MTCNTAAGVQGGAGVTGAHLAVGVGVEARATLVTPRALELWPAQAPARSITTLWERTDGTAATQLAEGVVEVPWSTPLTRIALEPASAVALTRGRVTGPVQAARARALAGLAV